MYPKTKVITRDNSCRLPMIPRSVIFNMLQYNLTEIALDHSKQRCVLRIFFSGAYRDYTCVDCEAYTVDENSRFPVLIT